MSLEFPIVRGGMEAGSRKGGGGNKEKIKMCLEKDHNSI